MSLETTGIIKEKLDVESGVSNAGKNWQSQTFILDTGSQYNPLVAFKCVGKEKVDKLSAFKEGDDVIVGFNVSSREFKGKWYTSLDAWKINQNRDSQPSSETVDVGEDDGSDLPF